MPVIAVDHYSVAAYALGMLGPAGMSAFEEHVADCQRCADQLAELVAVAVLLVEVEPGPRAPAPERRATPGRARRATVRSGLAVALLAAGFLVGLASGARFTVPAAPAPAPSAAPRAVFAATDPGTGVSARVGVLDKGWGSEVDLWLTGVTGPQRCELVGVTRDGTELVALTWGVPPGEGGTPPLVARGGLASGRVALDRFEVRTASGRVLVRVPVAG